LHISVFIASLHNNNQFRTEANYSLCLQCWVFKLYQEARNNMTEIFTISLVLEIDWWCQTPVSPPPKNSADLGDLEKWPTLPWRGGRLPPLALLPPVAAPMMSICGVKNLFF